jgi:putative ABC transport system permease protein
MRIGLLHIITRSLLHYKKGVFNQIIIIIILAAVITGSLLTGYSVKKSLRTTALTRMGNTSILISSGLRYFNPSLSQRFSANSGELSVPILELDGFCQIFTGGSLSKKVKIYGVGPDFFRFHGNDSTVIRNGEVAINKNLAKMIRINNGDEIIIRFKQISDIPADAPFSTSQSYGGSIVMKVGQILDEQHNGDFSLGINQIVPSNIFINLSDLENTSEKITRVNRVLVKNVNKKKLAFFHAILKRTTDISDLGLIIRKTGITGGQEIISNRIFIDQSTVEEIKKCLPATAPVITYLANSFTAGSKVTPYSFVSALSAELQQGLTGENGIIINQWLANDLNATLGDTIRMTWYAPDSINHLIEKSDRFIIKRIVQIDSIWGDRTLMPEFPGISNSETCSGWDAGVPVKMNKIRKKDEDYWKKFKGTPKAFIPYETGKLLWGNNFGPATALRFSENLSQKEIEEKLGSVLDPEQSGFTISDLREEALKAVSKSVDFGTLFISLGFFIILSSILLLSLSISAYFDVKKDNITTLYTLGFTNRQILKLLILETGFISIVGSILGSLFGLLFNSLIINALNSVWRGAVQTDTLSASTGIVPIFSGFLSTLIILVSLSWYKTDRFLKSLSKKRVGDLQFPSKQTNLLFLLSFAVISAASYFSSFLLKGFSTQFAFVAGSFLFLTLILFFRQYYLGGIIPSDLKILHNYNFSRLNYRFRPSYAIAPVIFIATGIFALFITSFNRVNYDMGENNKSGGTGGYLFWCETGVPVIQDLSATKAKREFGLEDDDFKGMEIVQIARKEGDDASCLNLNHVASPPILGIDPAIFINRGSFSFSSAISEFTGKNPWEMLGSAPLNNTIYGVADQTILEWGLKIKCGDTLVMKAESGQILKIIMAAGLRSSIFQGNILIGSANFKKFFPSVSGSSLFLVDGNPVLSERYKRILEERFVNYGISVDPATERLKSFYQVTNTYLSVFTILGAFGMIMGIFGLGFILSRNYHQRLKEFALLNATGFSIFRIRKYLLSDLFVILSAGIITGIISAIVATLPSIRGNSDLPWKILLVMILSVLITGISILFITVRMVSHETLISNLRKE